VSLSGSHLGRIVDLSFGGEAQAHSASEECAARIGPNFKNFDARRRVAALAARQIVAIDVSFWQSTTQE
jgi:hypothetical protein